MKRKPKASASRTPGDAAQRAVDPDLAGIGRDETRQRLDQRRLAGAVLAEKAVYGPRRDGEIDAVERPDAVEPFAEIADFQQHG
jgi:hypothetical protein